jgi:hypothetical protein
MELRALIIQAYNKITEDGCHRVTKDIAVRVEEVARCNCGHIEQLVYRDKCPCNGLSFCMLVSSTVIEIKIVLKYQILDHFMRHSVLLGNNP